LSGKRWGPICIQIKKTFERKGRKGFAKVAENLFVFLCVFCAALAIFAFKEFQFSQAARRIT